jgi:hypothetical protein
MLKTFRPWNPEQTTLLPPSPSDWLADDHQVYFLLDLVNELNLSAILGSAEAKDPRGEKGFDPRMMTLLLLRLLRGHRLFSLPGRRPACRRH